MVGAGFAGLAAASGLRNAPVEVLVLDRTNHHLFQPLLYQVASAGLSPSEIAVPIRRLFRGYDNVTVAMAEAQSVDPAARLIRSGLGMHRYDYLVVACGSEYSYFGHDDWARHAPALKTLSDAVEIRRRILLAFERAETTEDAAERRRLLTFVVVGGGPTGVELAGAIAEMARHALARDFRNIDPGAAAILLVEAAPRLLGGFPRPLSDFASRALERMGVTVRVNVPVADVSAGSVTIGNEIVETETVLWAAGTRVGGLPRTLGAETDRSGRVKVGPDLSLPGCPEIFVIGDAAHVAGRNGQPLPALAPVAKQEGDYVSKAILRRVRGEAAGHPFRYRDRGSLATVGRAAAIADLGWIRLRGWFAWIVWGVVHIYFLIGARNRAAVFLNWAWAYATYGLGARVITDRRGAGRDDERHGG